MLFVTLSDSDFAFAGQAYVALSRATSLEGLQVLNFDANKVTSIPARSIMPY